VSDPRELQRWVNFLFDHPVTEPEWYWAENAPEWTGRRERIPELIAEIFENAGDVLSSFSDEQLSQGLWFLAGDAPQELLLALLDGEVPLAARLRALRSFVPLFEQIMSKRCSPHLAHLDESGASPLNSACYMWWDMMPIGACPVESKRAEFDSTAILTMRNILAIPHDACRESALHGIGHWVVSYPQAGAIVDDFLALNNGLRPELVEYAKRAKAGNVL
jgi:hypothetical protein